MARCAPLVPLPFDPTPPTRAEVTASAADSPLLAAIDRLRRHVGDGLRLQPDGGLRLSAADVQRILGDDPPAVRAEPRLRLLLAVAVECGAIDDLGDRLAANLTWAAEDVVVRADTALGALLDLGPMRTVTDCGLALIALRDHVLDGSCMVLLATVLPDGQRQDVDQLTNSTIDLCRGELAGTPGADGHEFDCLVRSGVAYLLSTLQWAGAIVWEGHTLTGCPTDDSVHWPGGGAISLTPLGRYVVPDRLAESGLCLREPSAPGSQPAASLIGDLTMADGRRRSELVRSWRHDLAPADRARELCRALIEPGCGPLGVIVGFEALGLVGASAAEPFVRQLLDSPVAEHAASFLVEHGLADADALQPFIGYNPLIDHLATLVGHPAELNKWLVYLLEQSESPELMLEVIALHRGEAATMLLTAAARHVTDPRFADLVRAAERLHHHVLDDDEASSDDGPCDVAVAARHSN